MEDDGPTWMETAVIVTVFGAGIACAAFFVGYFTKEKEKKKQVEDDKEDDTDDDDDDYDDTDWLLR